MYHQKDLKAIDLSQVKGTLLEDNLIQFEGPSESIQRLYQIIFCFKQQSSDIASESLYEPGYTSPIKPLDLSIKKEAATKLTVQGDWQSLSEVFTKNNIAIKSTAATYKM